MKYRQKLLFTLLLLVSVANAMTVMQQWNTNGWTMAIGSGNPSSIITPRPDGEKNLYTDIYRNDVNGGIAAIFIPLGDSAIPAGTTAGNMPELWIQADFLYVGGNTSYAVMFGLFNSTGDNDGSPAINWTGVQFGGPDIQAIGKNTGSATLGSGQGNITQRVKAHIYNSGGKTLMDVSLYKIDAATFQITETNSLNGYIVLNTGQTFEQGLNVFGIRNTYSSSVRHNIIKFDNLYFSTNGAYGGKILPAWISSDFFNTPITHQSYFQQERELFGYNPPYTPNPVSYGFDENFYIKADGWIETTDYNGSLLKLNFARFITSTYPDWNGEFDSCGENRMAIDNFSCVYMIVKPSGKGYCLMYSKDLCRTWILYELPSSIADIRLECRDGGNVKTGLSGLLVRYIDSTNKLGFIRLTKDSSGNLILSDIKQVTTIPVIGSSFKTSSNSFVSYSDKTHIVFSSSVPNGSGTSQYAVTYDHSTDTMGTPVLLGNAGTGDPNENSWPCVCVDKNGFLHVLLNPLIGSSGNYCKYIRSSVSNSTTGGWTTAENLPAGLVRGSMVCDSNTTLHVAAADMVASNRALKYTYKPSGQSWSTPTSLVIPWNDNPAQPAPEAFYNQTLSIDSYNRLILNYSTKRNLINTAQQTAYGVYNPCNQSPENPAVIVKQAGSSWQLATVENLISKAPKIDTALTDSEFFDGLNLNFTGLEAVKAAVESKDLTTAKEELVKYFKTRTIKAFWFDPHIINPSAGNSSDMTNAYDIINHTGGWPESKWLANGEPDWLGNTETSWVRGYCFTSPGEAYWLSGQEYPAATAWITLMRSYIKQIPPDNASYGMDLNTGIRLRGGWTSAFNYFLLSPTFAANDNMILYLKSTMEQARHLRAGILAATSVPNHAMYARAGLYSAAVLFPEFNEATEWRTYACQTAINDMSESFLPDGGEIELSPGYGSTFSTQYYNNMYNLAVATDRLTESGLGQLTALTATPYEYLIKIMSPERYTPNYNDSGIAAVKTLMETAVTMHPDRQDFKWIATDGAQGTAPSYTSCFTPYAGFAAMRTGWDINANYLGFDVGYPGTSHVHQDKLNVVMWAYGRSIIFDPLRGDYSDTAISRWAADTFAHNTVLVDNRPQRRYWYWPDPSQMPYQPLTDVYWESDSSHDFARGVYDEAYSGIQGPSDVSPYKTGTNFSYGWVYPATHYRRVYFKKPDIFVVCDTLVDKVSSSHTYDVRWQLNSANTSVRNTYWVRTADSNLPNIDIVPLLTSGLSIYRTSGQMTPEILGYSGTDLIAKTTLQHKKAGSGTVHFLTLLVPMPSGQSTIVSSVATVNSTTWDVTLTDGRIYRISYSTSPTGSLSVILL